MQTGQQKSNIAPYISTMGTSSCQKSQSLKKYKVFSTLQQYLQSIQQIRLIDQLLRPTPKAEKQQILKRVNAVLLQIKEELDQIQTLCKFFIGKEQLFVEAELITLSQWRAEIKKIDKMMNGLLDHINEIYTIVAGVYGLQTKIFNVGAKEWRRKCQTVLRDPTCSCIKV